MENDLLGLQGRRMAISKVEIHVGLTVKVFWVEKKIEGRHKHFADSKKIKNLL